MYSKNDLLFKIPDQSVFKQAKGAFGKRVAVLVCAESSQTENTEFLRKVLLAAGLDLEKDTLFAKVSNGAPTSILPFVKTKHAESILVFGVRAEQLGLQVNFPKYEPALFYGTCFLFADKITVLEADTNLKRSLWQALQQMYIK